MLLNLPIKDEIKIWLYSKNLPLQPITEKELKWKELISCKNFHNYHHSRGYVRYSLSKLFKMPALDVPLYSNPREAPKLENKFLYFSSSSSESESKEEETPEVVDLQEISLKTSKSKSKSQKTDLWEAVHEYYKEQQKFN